MGDILYNLKLVKQGNPYNATISELNQMVEDWQGCKAKKCPYDKEHGNCEYCQYLVRKYDKLKEVIK